MVMIVADVLALDSCGHGMVANLPRSATERAIEVCMN